MKILVISHEYPPIGGGGANACMFLTNGFAAKGHEVTLVTVWFEGEKEYEKKENLTIYRLRSKRSHKEHCSFKEMADYLWKATPKAVKLQKQNHYDVCLVFFGIPSGPVGYWLKKRYKLPYVVRFGGGDIPGFQDRFSTVYKMIGIFVKTIWKNAGALIANSEGLKDFAKNFYNKKTISVIHNGVDLEKYYPDKNKRKNGEINLLFVSRLIERKGLQYLIPELPRIQENTDKRVRLTIVGDGPYREYLENLVEEYQVKDNVEFVGQKDKDELLPYYQSGDIFVFPSKREGMPNVVLEAMACGLPIIMTPCEGSGELVTTNGVIAETTDFAKYIEEFSNNEVLRLEYGKESRRRAEEEFAWDRIVKQYLDVMEKIKL